MTLKEFKRLGALAEKEKKTRDRLKRFVAFQEWLKHAQECSRCNMILEERRTRFEMREEEKRVAQMEPAHKVAGDLFTRLKQS